MDLEPILEYIPMPGHLKGKYQYHTEARMQKIREAGYHRPVTVLEDAVADYVKGHLMTGKHLVP